MKEWLYNKIILFINFLGSQYFNYLNIEKKIHNHNFKNPIHKFLLLNKEYINNLNKILLKHHQEINDKLQDMMFENKTIHTVECNIPYIYINDESLSHNECDLFINYFEQMVKEGNTGDTGKTVGGYNPFKRYVNKYSLFTEDNKQNIIFNKILCNKLNEELKKYSNFCIKKYHNYFLSLNPFIRDTGFDILKYDKGSHYYRWHRDNIIQDYHKKNDGYRMITYIWYLNDVNEGGETCFYNYKVKPKKGRLLLFPSSWQYNHKAETPISNHKYAIVGWVITCNFYNNY